MLFLFLLFSISAFAQDAQQQERDTAYKLYSGGNYKDAYDVYRKISLSSEGGLDSLTNDLSTAISCLSSLGNDDDLEKLLDEVLTAHPKQWKAKAAVAHGYTIIPHNGTIVAGKFNRGKFDGIGKYVDSTERDRIRSIQLLLEAILLSASEPSPSQRSTLYSTLANTLSRGFNGSEAWMLQHLTDLTMLPDYDDYNLRYSGVRNVGAPVNVKGEPIFYSVPETFESALNDGERMRWALVEQMRLDVNSTDAVRYQLAQFLDAQFGVATLANYGVFNSGTDQAETGTFALHTLTDDETIARFATGIKRVTLPAEFNPIKIYTSLTETEKTPGQSGYAEAARNAVCEIFINRRQYVRAEECVRRAIEVYGPGFSNQRQQQLDQIVGAWGQFEPIGTQAAENKSSIEYRFRNGSSLALEAYEINIDRLLEDTKEYLRGNPNNLDYQKVSFDYVGYRIVTENETRFRGEKVASWTQPLEPRKNHFDTRTTITTPLKKAGAYLVVAKLAGGNESRIILWLADGALIKKPLDKGAYYYFGDARNGAPLPEADVEFFGYKTEYINDRNLVNKLSGRTYNIVTAGTKKPQRL